MALRDVHSALKTALILNDEFTFSHLIKFEKPKRSTEENFGTEDFAYITDGPYPIVYAGDTYLPRNVYKVGAIKEFTEAKASNMTLELGANALGTEKDITATFSSEAAVGLAHHINFNKAESDSDNHIQFIDQVSSNYSNVNSKAGGYSSDLRDYVDSSDGPASDVNSYISKSSRYLSILNSSHLNQIFYESATAWSISLWFKSTLASGGDASAPILSLRPGVHITNGTVSLALNQTTNTGGQQTLYSAPSGSSVSVAINTWNHAVLTFDGTSVKTYINAVESTSTTSYSADAAVTQMAIGSHVSAGRIPSFKGDDFNGKVALLRIHNTTLSPSEVSYLYNNPAPHNGSLQLSTSNDLVDAGFHVGDVVTFEGSGGNNGTKGRILTFKNGNKDVDLSPIGPGFTRETNASYKIKLDNSEIASLLIPKSDPSYATYLHREVNIYRAYHNPETGAIIGEPFLVFRGHINTGSIDQDVGRETKVKWSLTSHWGDFVRVNGRLTSDRHHRALDVNNNSDRNALKNLDYEEDWGFEHAEKAVNIVANYLTYEKRYKMKKRGGLAGAIGLKKQIEYDVEVVKDVDLRFNLSAKYLPVVYGVQKVDSFPIFADTLIEDPDTDELEASQLFLALAICEGEVGGLYDVHIDDQSSLCTDLVDYNVRGQDNPNRTETNVLCRGRADRGSVLGGSPGWLTQEWSNWFTEYYQPLAINLQAAAEYDPESAEAQIREAVLAGDQIPKLLNHTGNFKQIIGVQGGVTHDTRIDFTTPIRSSLHFFSGRPSQEASNLLQNESIFGRYRIQNDYYKGNPTYWSAKHRLLDTSYVAGHFKLKEGETTIPKYTFIVKGSYVDCHNYDGSYAPSAFASLATYNNLSTSDFLEGVYVKFYDENNQQISAGSDNSYSAQMIIDRFSVTSKELTDAHSSLQIRYRFEKAPNVAEANGSFYMKKEGTSIKHYMMAPQTTAVTGGHVNLKKIPDIDTTIDQLRRSTGGGNILYGSSYYNPQVISAASPGLSANSRYIAETVTAAYANNREYVDFYTGSSTTGANVYSVEFSINEFFGSKHYNVSDALIFRVYDNTQGETLNSNIVLQGYHTSDTFKLLAGGGGLFTGGISVDHVNRFDNGNDLRIFCANVIQLDYSTGEQFEVGQSVEILFDDGFSQKVSIAEAYSDGYVRLSGALLRLPTETTIVTEYSNRIANMGVDKRISNNPAIQLLDYLTDKRYGKGLDVDKDINLETFKAAARKCDERSDVTVVVAANSFSSNNVGSVYKVNLNNQTDSRLLFQGTIKKVENIGGKQQVVFDNVVGKLIHKWTDWRTWELGDYVYHDGKPYNPLQTAAISESALKAGGVYTGDITLRNVKGSGPATANILFSTTGDIDEITTGEGNPVVRSYSTIYKNFTNTGYSLYDSDNVKYWKLIGWDKNDQRNVTRHQTNCVIDTSKPLFNNVNLILSQFNGILRYNQGKYELDVKSAAPSVLDGIDINGSVYQPGHINKDEIIGRLKLVDKQQKDTFNSVSTQIIDPHNKFGTTDVTFFNSDYLIQDRNINKSGTLEQPHVTNYYNARINVEQYLDQSRAGMKVSFKTLPKASLLLPGEFIKLTHEEYGFDNKIFRILEVTLEPDGLTSLTAEEYIDKAYKLSAVDSGIKKFDGGAERNTPDILDIKSPAALTISQSIVQAVTLTWDNSKKYGHDTHSVEIYRSAQNSLASASAIATTRGFEFTDYFDNTVNSVTNYYWIRYKVANTSGEIDAPQFLTSNYLYNTSVSASSGFVGVAMPLNASNVKYADGNTIEVLEPAEGGADTTSNALNNTVGGSSSALKVTTATGGLTFETGGAIRSAGKQTADDSLNSGFFLGYETSRYTFGVGDGNSSLVWSGSSLTLTGKVIADSGDIGGWGITGSSIYAGLTSSEASSFTPTGYIEGLAANQNAIVLHTQGSLHSKNFFINSDGTSSFRGDISGATGTFAGGVANQSITADQIQDGSVGAEELAPEAISGFNISPGGTIAVFQRDASGDIIPSSYAALDGADDLYRIYAGDTAAGSAPFRVTKEGQVIADNFQLFDSNNNVFFDSSTGGFSESALTQIAQKFESRVDSFSELFTGELDLNTDSTFERITLTDPSTHLTSSIKIPARMARTVSEEYYGNRSNPYTFTVDVSTLSADLSLGLSDIKKPGGVDSASALKLGEVIRLNLANTVPGMVLKSVVGAKNALTGNDFANPTTIGAPSTVNFIIFELDSTSETFAFTVSSQNTGNITMSAGTNTIAKPDTETTALAAIPSSVTFGLSVRSGSSGATASAEVLASKVFTKTTSATPSSTQYRIKTVSKDIVDVNTIHSSVSIVSGGCVDSQGFITRSSSTSVSAAAGSYWYYSNLSVSGGDASLRPTKRLFNVAVDSGETGFIIQGAGTATQSAQPNAFSNLVLSGNMAVSDGFTIDPGSTNNDVIIAGNLTVQGTQTTTATQSLEIADKTILVSANATQVSDVHNSGIVVDRSAITNGGADVTFRWNETDYSSWLASETIMAPDFRSTTDGTADNPAYIFGNRTTKTGLFAETTSAGGDRINITTKNASGTSDVSYFDSEGIHSHSSVITSETGHFKNILGDWIASTTSGNKKFKFIGNYPTSTTSILTIDSSGTPSVGIMNDSPIAPLTIGSGALIEANALDANVAILDPNPVLLLSSSASNAATSRIYFTNHNPSSQGNTLIQAKGRTSGSQELTFWVGGVKRLELKDDSTNNATFYSSTNTAPTSTNSTINLQNNQPNTSGNSNELRTSISFTNMKAQTIDNVLSHVTQTRGTLECGTLTSEGGAYGFFQFRLPETGQTGDLTPAKTPLELRYGGFGENHVLCGEDMNVHEEAHLSVKGSEAASTNIKLITDSDSVSSLTAINFFNGKSSTHSTNRSKGRITLQKATGAGRGGIMKFSTTGTVSAATINRMTIDEVGNVGFGEETQQPNAQIHNRNLGIISTKTGIFNDQATIVASFNTAYWRSAKVTVQMEHPTAGKYMTTEVSILWDNTATPNIHMTEYATVLINDRDVTLTTSYDNGFIHLKATNTGYNTNNGARTITSNMYLTQKA